MINAPSMILLQGGETMKPVKKDKDTNKKSLN